MKNNMVLLIFLIKLLLIFRNYVFNICSISRSKTYHKKHLIWTIYSVWLRLFQIKLIQKICFYNVFQFPIMAKSTIINLKVWPWSKRNSTDTRYLLPFRTIATNDLFIIFTVLSSFTLNKSVLWTIDDAKNRKMKRRKQFKLFACKIFYVL